MKKFFLISLAVLGLAACTSQPTQPMTEASMPPPQSVPAGPEGVNYADPVREPSADHLVFKLHCAIDQGERRAGGMRYEMVKTVTKRGNRWDEDYNLYGIQSGVRNAKPVVYKLQPKGAGDEDYHEYDVLGSREVQAVYLQDAFKWANLINNEGRSFARCSPATRK